MCLQKKHVTTEWQLNIKYYLKDLLWYSIAILICFIDLQKDYIYKTLIECESLGS